MLAAHLIRYLRMCGTRFGESVGSAYELYDLQENQKIASPSLWVMAGVEASQGAGPDSKFDITTTMAVVAVLDVSKDKRSAKTITEVTDIRDELLGCLVGWEPDDCYGPGFYLGFQPLDNDRAQLIYQFNFAWRQYRLDPDDVGVSETRQSAWDEELGRAPMSTIENIRGGVRYAEIPGAGRQEDACDDCG